MKLSSWRIKKSPRHFLGGLIFKILTILITIRITYYTCDQRKPLSQMIIAWQAVLLFKIIQGPPQRFFDINDPTAAIHNQMAIGKVVLLKSLKRPEAPDHFSALALENSIDCQPNSNSFAFLNRTNTSDSLEFKHFLFLKFYCVSK